MPDAVPHDSVTDIRPANWAAAIGRPLDRAGHDASERELHRGLLRRRTEFAPTVHLAMARARALAVAKFARLMPAPRPGAVGAAYGFAAVWAANLRDDDTVLDPVAGTGALAVHARNAGARVLVNERDPERQALLLDLGFERVLREDPRRLSRDLAGKVHPSVVLLAVPDGAGAETLVQESLRLLRRGGRLVAILDRGMAPARTAWWGAVTSRFAARANLGVHRSLCHGVETRLVVIDNGGRGSDDTLSGDAASVDDLLVRLGEVRSRAAWAPAEPAAPPQPIEIREPPPWDPPLLPEPVTEEATAPAAHPPVRTITSPSPATEDAPPAAPSPSDAPLLTRHDAGADARYETYVPQRLTIPGAWPHPGKLVQSVAMAAVLPPAPTYVPALPADVITDGRLSLPQLEAVVYAGQAHQQWLPPAGDGPACRIGFACGDGTGVGKGRSISGIILDNMHQGRPRAVWVTKDDTKLLRAARRDFEDAGGDPALVFPLSDTRAGETVEDRDGVLLVSYGILRSKPRNKKPRLDQILEWVGPDFEGVLVFDEIHRAQNALDTEGDRGIQNASQTGMAAVELQRRLPKARVVYVSATVADKPANLSPCERLGLWGPGTPFEDKRAFCAQIESGGLAAMELVARDLKAMGRYIARSLSYEDIRYDRLVHPLTTDQAEMYDMAALAWQIVLTHVHEALALTGGDGDKDAKAKAWSAYWGAHQRFFNQVLTSFMMPTVMEAVALDVEAGHAPLLYFVNTNEAAMERALARDGALDDLDDLDMTPRELLSQYLELCFPTAEIEEYLDEQGVRRTRPRLDAEGRPVHNPAAVALRDDLLLQIGTLQVPHGPLEYVLDRFGIGQVAEITGRSRRVVFLPDGRGGQKKQIQTRSEAHRLADLRDFEDDRKRIVAFSNAGNTGIDLHASLRVRNQRLRKLYVVQAGWSAKEATQACGRPHRSNQAQAPEIILCTTDLKGQKRFITSIARRLGQLGALTRGQRDTGEQGLFTERDNLEGDHGTAAVHQIALELYHGETVGGLGIKDFQEQLGLKLVNAQGQLLKDKLPTVRQFLNRLLSMTIEPQNALFEEFQARLDQNVQAALDAGTLNVGMETVRAESIAPAGEPITIYRHQASGAETRYVELRVRRRPKILPFEQARDLPARTRWVHNRQSGRVYAVLPAQSRTRDDGKVTRQVRLVGPTAAHYADAEIVESAGTGYQRLGTEDAAALWQQEIERAPAVEESTLHLVSGIVLPIWDKLGEGRKVYRVHADDGRLLIGRTLEAKEVRTTLKTFGVALDRPWTVAEILHIVLAEGGKVPLAGGWTLVCSLVNSIPRVELKGPRYPDIVAVKRLGFETVMVAGQTRFLLPAQAQKPVAELIRWKPPADDGPDLAAGRKPAPPPQTGQPRMDRPTGTGTIYTDGVHVVVDGADYEALHRFAQRIGLRRDWFQGDHYDLTTQNKAEQAVRAGAVLVSLRDVGLVSRPRHRPPGWRPQPLHPNDLGARIAAARARNTELLRLFAGNRPIGQRGVEHLS